MSPLDSQDKNNLKGCVMVMADPSDLGQGKNCHSVSESEMKLLLVEACLQARAVIDHKSRLQGRNHEKGVIVNIQGNVTIDMAYGTNQRGWERSQTDGFYLKCLAPPWDQNWFLW